MIIVIPHDRGFIFLIINLFQDYNKKRGKDIADYTVGIFQSIGFKEFHNYMLLSEAEQNSTSGNDLFENGKELMMIATRQYARRQKKWIRQRFLRSDRYLLMRLMQILLQTVQFYNCIIFGFG